MSAEPAIGSFFAVSLEEIHEIAEKSGNADCILAMIALRRGQGRKANTGWGRISIKKHMALPHSRANKAIDWLLENRFFVEGRRETKRKGKDDGKSEAEGKAHLFPVRALPDIANKIYLPNRLVDNVDGGKDGGSLGQLMRNIQTDLWNKISTDQAQLDALLVLIALYKQHQEGKAREDLVWWHWDTQTAKGKAKSLETSDKQKLCVLDATKGALQFNPVEAKKAFGNTASAHEILPRITLAIDNLKELGLIYTLTSVWRVTLSGKAKCLEQKFERAYVLDSDFVGPAEPLRISPLKELVRDFSEHLNRKDGTSLRPAFSSEHVEFISSSVGWYVPRSTIEPAHLPDSEDLIEISAQLNKLCTTWSNAIKDAINNDLILH
ncbi:hypothetical protein [Duganella callida]|uniref:Uncharacterized protein n=1 Tax=Duganella callida TaxID=2561932 RepID=A0A4Y9SDN0_9BURK|nr:hypothetical protein [Duganella callida]TFW18665.1 hypothetical protein E4L98_17615 [Duganella callida]